MPEQKLSTNLSCRHVEGFVQDPEFNLATSEILKPKFKTMKGMDFTLHRKLNIWRADQP